MPTHNRVFRKGTKVATYERPPYRAADRDTDIDQGIAVLPLPDSVPTTGNGVEPGPVRTYAHVLVRALLLTAALCAVAYVSGEPNPVPSPAPAVVPPKPAPVVTRREWRPDLRPFLVFDATRSGEADFRTSIMVDFRNHRPPDAAFSDSVLEVFERMEVLRDLMRVQYLAQRRGKARVFSSTNNLSLTGWKIMKALDPVKTSKNPDPASLWVLIYIQHVRAEVCWAHEYEALLRSDAYVETFDSDVRDLAMNRLPQHVVASETRMAMRRVLKLRNDLLWKVIGLYKPGFDPKDAPAGAFEYDRLWEEVLALRLIGFSDVVVEKGVRGE
jgi:hypothetical protein